MNALNTLYVKDRKEWRRWLETNFKREKDIWLIYPHISTKKPKILYNDAVEEALCYGWIDSTVKSFDKESSIQRFCPRRPGSNFSQPNKERIKWLAGKKMIHPSIEEKVQDIIHEKYIFPEDILHILKKDKTVWENYQKFPEPYRRIRIAYIDNSRNNPEAFEKRLISFMKKTRENKIIKGYGGIEKYYNFSGK